MERENGYSRTPASLEAWYLNVNVEVRVRGKGKSKRKGYMSEGDGSLVNFQGEWQIAHRHVATLIIQSYNLAPCDITFKLSSAA